MITPDHLQNARDLHEGLQISTPFHKWIQRRIADFNFIENLDFTVTDKFVRLDRGMFGIRDETIKDYHLTLDMAKELCMLGEIKLFEDLHEKIDLIGFMPLGIGRLRDDGTREAFCRGYRIVYTITGNNVYITTIIHSRRCYPLINPG